jgi:hypothetical protein
MLKGEKAMKGNCPRDKTVKSRNGRKISTSDEWATNKLVFEFIRYLYGTEVIEQMVDVCEALTNPDEYNALLCAWKHDVVFLNPPFSDMTRFMHKLADEIEEGNTKRCLLLCPVTVCKYWEKLDKYVHEVSLLPPLSYGKIDPITKSIDWNQPKFYKPLMLMDIRDTKRRTRKCSMRFHTNAIWEKL